MYGEHWEKERKGKEKKCVLGVVAWSLGRGSFSQHGDIEQRWEEEG